jgi:hypothetical protein
LTRPPDNDPDPSIVLFTQLGIVGSEVNTSAQSKAAESGTAEKWGDYPGTANVFQLLKPHGR